ncbi:MAG: maleylpyruvate isomerase family mycothiol-dependent enzyme [Acidimicrobiia bacterium]
MDATHAPEPLDVLDLLGPERRLLCDLLAGLTAEQWSTTTECPAWTVRGVALHVLGDDLSLLARQRDAEVPSLLTEASLPTWDGAPPAVLDRFNERWVHASTFLSPALVVELLRQTGEWTSRWYEEVDPDAPGEVVLLFGPGPAPYREIAAREYVERWVHHLQIRRALGLDAGALGARPLGERAHAVIARALATLLTMVTPPTAGPIVLDLGGTAWTYRADSTGVRQVAPGPAADAVVTLTVDAALTTPLLSRGLTAGAAEAAIRATGDPELATTLRSSIAAVSSSYYAAL